MFRRFLSIRFSATLAVIAGFLPGCGGDMTLLVSGPSLRQARDGVDYVILDWSGGVSALFPSEELPPLDLGKFGTAGGGTLADRAEEFRAAVLAEVTAIVSGMPHAEVRIENGLNASSTRATVVHIAQTPSFGAPGQIGRGEYDPCNTYQDDAAVVFGEELARLGRDFTFDEWVYVVANVTAHEIGHTLGYGHIARGVSDAHRPLFVELMLATHTVDEMRQQQRYMADESNCPSPTPANFRVASELSESCGILHD